MVSQTLESKYLSEQIIRERLAQLFPGDSSIHIEVLPRDQFKVKVPRRLTEDEIIALQEKPADA